MSLIGELRRNRRTRQEAFAAAEQEYDRFLNPLWASETTWRRRGYSVVTGRGEAVTTSFLTPRGRVEYEVYHPYSVTIRPAVWRKMLRVLPDDYRHLSWADLPAREIVQDQLRLRGRDPMAERLGHVGIRASEPSYEADVALLQALREKLAEAKLAFESASAMYHDALRPTLERRHRAIARRESLEALAHAGGGIDDFGESASPEEISREADRLSSLRDLLGRGVRGVRADFSLDQLRRLRHDHDRLQRLEALGVNVGTLPEDVPISEAWRLVFGDGYLCTVSKDISGQALRDDLRAREKTLALWALDGVPETWLVAEPCPDTPGRIKLRVNRPGPRRARRRSRSRPVAAVDWRAVGF